MHNTAVFSMTYCSVSYGILQCLVWHTLQCLVWQWSVQQLIVFSATDCGVPFNIIWRSVQRILVLSTTYCTVQWVKIQSSLQHTAAFKATDWSIFETHAPTYLQIVKIYQARYIIQCITTGAWQAFYNLI